MKLQIVYNQLIIGLAILLLYSCDPFFNCIEGSGDLITEDRLVAEFVTVENTTSMDIDVIADSFFQVKITADESLLSYINTTVRGKTLIIDTDHNSCFKSNETILIEIRMPILEGIESSGSGDIQVTDFDCDALDVNNSGSGKVDITNLFCELEVKLRVSGSGNIVLDGKCATADYEVSGSGDIIADAFRTDICDISISGSGDVYCWVEKELSVKISGSGDVIFEGSADVDSNITGSGEVRHRNK